MDFQIPFFLGQFSVLPYQVFIFTCVGPAALSGSLATLQGNWTGLLLSLPYAGLASAQRALAEDAEEVGRVWWRQSCQEGAPPQEFSGLGKHPDCLATILKMNDHQTQPLSARK